MSNIFEWIFSWLVTILLVFNVILFIMNLTLRQVIDFEEIHGNVFTIRTIPRAREVGQSYSSSVPTTLKALWHSFILVWEEKPDVVMTNGPGIAFGICLFARLFDLIGKNQCRVVFIESICRVQRLSLTGWLLYHLWIPHSFLVQWPELKKKYQRVEYIGRVV